MKVKLELLNFQRNPALGFTMKTADQDFKIARRIVHQEPINMSERRRKTLLYYAGTLGVELE